MKKAGCAILTALWTLLCLGGALAEQKVQLPESSYRMTIPDGMEYDGPGETPDDARFAWVSAEMGLEIDFFCRQNPNGVSLQAMAEVLVGEEIDTQIRRINGVDMIVFRTTDPGDPPETAMKCVGYLLEDGEKVQMICFWYATQEAADQTERSS